MRNFKILLVMLALISWSNVLMAQTVIIVEPDLTYRVQCWSDGDGTEHLSLDENCNINLNGNEDGNNQDTLKLPIGTTCEVEAGSEGNYYSYSWMGIWDTYTITVDTEGSWVVSKLSNVTGYTYVGHFWVKYYDPSDVVDIADKINIKIYPNPVTDYLMIKYNRDMRWELMSITGQVLKTGSSERINLNSLNTGYYVLKIITAKEIVNKKILKR